MGLINGSFKIKALSEHVNLTLLSVLSLLNTFVLFISFSKPTVHTSTTNKTSYEFGLPICPVVLINDINMMILRLNLGKHLN